MKRKNDFYTNIRPRSCRMTVGERNGAIVTAAIMALTPAAMKNAARIILLAAMMFVLFAARPLTVNAQAVPASYLDENGVLQACPFATVLTGGGATALGTAGTVTWYLVPTGTTAYSGRITISGDVHIILADGCQLTASDGINVTGTNSLAVYAQSTTMPGMGILAATATTSTCAGIGGNDGEPGGTITINGGSVTAGAASGGNGAGIGGGYHGAGGNITINGGVVIATGSHGAGIGGCNTGSGGNITITGGEITANGDGDGAGIGGGGGSLVSGDGGTITISGGSVTAIGGARGAGIGGGYYTAGGNITITGNAIATATGGGTFGSDNNGGGAGIGGGAGYYHSHNLSSGASGNITISGNASVTATGGRSIDNGGGAGIGSGGAGSYNGTSGTVGVVNTITITTTGTVTATGGAGGTGNGAGIGSGGGGGLNGAPYYTINIATQPNASTTATAGSITQSLAINATIAPATSPLSYQWYSNTANANTGGMAVSGATGTIFQIPAGLTAGVYYYYCIASVAGAVPVTSNVATVTVNTAPVAADFTTANLAQVEGSVTAVTVMPNSGKSQGAITVYYDGSTTLPAAQGSYAVTFDVAADAANLFTAATDLAGGTLVINAVPVAADFTTANLTQVEGSVTAVTVTPNSGKSQGAITVYYDGSTTLPSAQGSYTVTFDVAADATNLFTAATDLAGGTLVINAIPVIVVPNPDPAPDPTIYVTGVRLNLASLEGKVGDDGVELVATVAPRFATDRNVRWSTSDPLVATVTHYGLVNFIGAGTATITVITLDGDYTAECVVTVSTDTGTEGIDSALKVYFQGNTLYVCSPAAETIEVYSFSGERIFSAKKDAGEATFTVPTSLKAVIVRGSSGWTKKMGN